VSVRSAVGDQGIVERDGELARIEAAVASATSGSGSVVVVEGPAGIGKSRLLAEARDCAAGGGMRVLAARGGAFERDLAFGAARLLFERELASLPEDEVEALLAGAAGLARPALAAAGQDARVPPDRSFAVLHGLYWLVANLAEQAPLLLALDDVHWFDPPSLRFLLYLARRIEDLPVLAIACARRAEEGSEPLLVDELLAQPGVAILRPRPLSREGVATLLRERTARDDVAPEFSAACHEVAGGNPFLLSQLMGGLLASGVVPDAAGAAQARHVRPEALSRSVLLRLSRMPAGAAALAVAVAVLGEDVALHDARELAELDEQLAARALDRLAAAEILAAEQPLHFVHPIVREAVYGDLGPAERMRWHAHAAQLLQRHATGSGRLASHLLQTAPEGSPATVAALTSAARAALERGAPEIAARYLRRAVAEPPDPDALAGVLLQLGAASFLAGEHLDEVQSHVRAAIDETSDPGTRMGAWLLLARATLLHGRAPAAAAVLEEAIADTGDERLLRPLEAELAAVGLTHPDTCERAAARIDRLAVPAGENHVERLALCNIAARAGFEGRPSGEVAELCRRALGGGRFVAAEGADSSALYQAIWMLATTDCAGEARAAAEIALADGRARGSLWGISAGLGLRAFASFRSGAISDAVADGRQALAVPGLPSIAVVPLSVRLVMALIERGELDEADAILVRAGAGPDLPEIMTTSLAIYARGVLRLAQRRTGDALADLVEFGRRAERLRLRNPEYAWRAQAALALARLGEHDEAQRLAAEHAALAQRWATASAIGVALRVRGLLAAGQPGVALLREAADAHAASPMLHEHARTLLELGAALRRAGRRSEAIDVLQRAVDLARRCGALATAGRAHEELTIAGARPRRLQFSGAESLTPSERRVAQLAAQGLANREIAESLFITAKTVENHLGRTYTKLGIGSREQLGGLLK